jgi:hypothetical protein
MAHDHFAQLDPADATVTDAEHQEYPHHEQSARHSHDHHGHDQKRRETDDDEDLSFNDSSDARAPRQKKLPIPVLLGGGFIVFIALFAGYKKIFGHPARPVSVPTTVASLPADDGIAGNGNGGMMAQGAQAGNGSVNSLPAELPSSAEAAPALLTVADLGVAASATLASSSPQVPSLSATSVVTSDSRSLPVATQTHQDLPSALGAPSTGGPAPAATAGVTTTADAAATSTIMSAPAVPASGAQEAPVETRAAKIARLEHELSQLRGNRPASQRVKHVANAKSDERSTTDTATTDSEAMSDAADHSVHQVSTRATRKAKHSRLLETQVGWHIKQVIPGQGWVEDENNGKQVVVSIGDRIGGAEVTKIDADGGKIYTTAGVIQ